MLRYPTKDELKKIAEWPHDDYKRLMEFVKERWEFSDVGYFEQDGDRYFLSTGGWSGNEEIIHALYENLLFWALCWQSSRRGGHYEFIVK